MVVFEVFGETPIARVFDGFEEGRAGWWGTSGHALVWVAACEARLSHGDEATEVGDVAGE